jgi:hypothetical protein
MDVGEAMVRTPRTAIIDVGMVTGTHETNGARSTSTGPRFKAGCGLAATQRPSWKTWRRRT